MPTTTFKYLTIQGGGTPQPLIGTWLTAAVTAGQLGGAVTLTVNDSSMFAGAFYAVITDPTTYAAERVSVGPIVSPTSLTVTGLRNPHPGGAYGTGSWIGVSDSASQVYVQSKDGGAGALFVGNTPRMVTGTGVGVIAKIVAVSTGTQPTEWYTPTHDLDIESSQYWIDGTTGDSYLPSLGKV